MQKFILIALVFVIGAASTSKNFEDTKSNEKDIEEEYCRKFSSSFWKYLKTYLEGPGEDGISVTT